VLRRLRALSRRHSLLADSLQDLYFAPPPSSSTVNPTASSTSGPKKGKRVAVKVDELVLLYEKLISNLSDMLEGPTAPTDPSRLSVLGMEKAAAEARRTFFIAESHVRVGQLSEAAALLQRVEERIEKARELKPKTAEPTSDAELSGVLSQLNDLSARVRTQLLVLRAKFALQRVGGERDTQRAMSSLSLTDASKAASAPTSTASSAFTSATGPLLSRVDSFSVGPASAHFAITDWPPAYAAVPCKPVLFDLAFNAVEYPDISTGGKEKGKAEATRPVEEKEEEGGEEEAGEEAAEESPSAESQPSKGGGGLLGAVGGAVGGLGKWVWRR
jgi:signal recognition particle subunit SRP68